MSASDAFEGLFGGLRGRPRPARRQRSGAGRALTAIASDAQRQPQDPAAVHALAADVREHLRWRVLAVRDEPLLRLALASLVAGAHTAYEQRPSARGKAGRAEVEALRLALADARVLLAEVAGDRAGDWGAVLTSRGRQKGVLRGAALVRWRRALDADRALLAQP